MKPKILTFDIEISPNITYCWGFYEQNVIEVVKPWYVLTIAYKWADEKKARVLKLSDYPLFNTDHQDDRDLVKDFWDVLDKADIVVGQNSDAFDIKKMNTRFLIHGLPPPSNYKTVDTKKTSKKHFSFINNKLDNLGTELGLGGKMHHEGFDLWKKCMAGDRKAFDRMAKYNIRDVYLTEKVYLAQRPYMSGHPNVNAYTEKEGCRNCASEKVIFRGFMYTANGKKRRWSCNDCGAWTSDSKTVSTTSKR